MGVRHRSNFIYLWSRFSLSNSVYVKVIPSSKGNTISVLLGKGIRCKLFDFNPMEDYAEMNERDHLLKEVEELTKKKRRVDIITDAMKAFVLSPILLLGVPISCALDSLSPTRTVKRDTRSIIMRMFNEAVKINEDEAPLTPDQVKDVIELYNAMNGFGPNYAPSHVSFEINDHIYTLDMECGTVLKREKITHLDDSLNSNYGACT